MNASRRVSIILAGGRSERLFPLKSPKPLLKVNGKSLLLQTLDRVRGSKRFILTNANLVPLFRKELRAPGYRDVQFLIEPSPKDTAPAIAFALHKLKKIRPDSVAILSADHYIPSTKKFVKCIEKVFKELEEFPESIFLMGISARSQSRSDFGQFGWIVPKKNQRASLKVLGFVEKPKPVKISGLLRKGGLINAGLFFAKYSTFCEAFNLHYAKNFLQRFDFEKLNRISIDHAVISKCKELRVVPYRDAWNDVGTWPALKKMGLETPYQQVKSESCSVFAGPKNQIFLVGVRNLVVVVDEDRTLICAKEKITQLKNLLPKLKKEGLHE